MYKEANYSEGPTAKWDRMYIRIICHALLPPVHSMPCVFVYFNHSVSPLRSVLNQQAQLLRSSSRSWINTLDPQFDVLNNITAGTLSHNSLSWAIQAISCKKSKKNILHTSRPVPKWNLDLHNISWCIKHLWTAQLTNFSKFANKFFKPALKFKMHCGRLPRALAHAMEQQAFRINTHFKLHYYAMIMYLWQKWCWLWWIAYPEQDDADMLLNRDMHR